MKFYTKGQLLRAVGLRGARINFITRFYSYTNNRERLTYHIDQLRYLHQHPLEARAQKGQSINSCPAHNVPIIAYNLIGLI